VVGEGARYIVIGLAAGSAMAAGLMRFVSTMLFGLGSFDLPTFLQVSAVIGAVSLLACAVPTLRALELGAPLNPE
jgi:hypothetical protein